MPKYIRFADLQPGIKLVLENQPEGKNLAAYAVVKTKPYPGMIRGNLCVDIQTFLRGDDTTVKINNTWTECKPDSQMELWEE